MSSAVADTLYDLARALDGIGDGWYLFGAQAALLRGSARMTHDVDVTLLPGDTPPADVVARLRAVGFTLRVQDADDFVARTRVLPVVHDATQMPVDVVLGGPGLERLFLDASERMRIDATDVSVPTSEHLVVMKLLAGRSLDLDDAVAIANAQTIDHNAVRSLVDAIADGLGEDDIRNAYAALVARSSGQGC
jgi:hypothetical protein